MSIVAFYAFVLPAANLLLQRYVFDRTFDTFVAPQLEADRIALVSRLLPRLKHELWRSEIDIAQPAVILIGNSTQFEMSRRQLETAFGCPMPNYYNFAYHSIDIHDSREMLAVNGPYLQPGSTVLFAVYPEMFLVAARQAAPSIDHPWTSLATWWLNIKDGNGSIVTLYPVFLHIEWPLSFATTLPFVGYYTELFGLLEDGRPDEYYYHDGAVEFIGQPQANAERAARGELLDSANFRAQALADLTTPYHTPSFDEFGELIRWLDGRGIRTVAFEAILNPDYGFARRADETAMAPYLSALAALDAAVGSFEYVPGDRTYIEIPDRYWYDNAHIAPEGGPLVAAQLAQAIDPTAVCLPPPR